MCILNIDDRTQVELYESPFLLNLESHSLILKYLASQKDQIAHDNLVHPLPMQIVKNPHTPQMII